MVRKGRRCTVLYFLLILSGFAGMGYEMVWTRMLGVGLGHEIAAVLAVVCAFFFGLALGGWSLDGVISRSLRPGRWYAVLELVIGAWALSLLWGIPWANDVALRLLGTAPGPVRQWAVSFVVPMITFLPATFAMGGTIVKSYLKVFPDATAYVANYSLTSPMIALVSTGRTYPYDWLEVRVKDLDLRKSLQKLELFDKFALFGCFVADHDDLAAFSGTSPVNTDQYPHVMFGAPKFTYGNPEPAHERLLAFLAAVSPQPEAVLNQAVSNEDEQVLARLAAYWKARDQFLKVGVGARRSTDVRRMVALVRNPLLQVVRISPDFAPAYDPFLMMAGQLHRLDPVAAQKLLCDLEKANPQRKEAQQLRKFLLRLSPHRADLDVSTLEADADSGISAQDCPN